MRSGTRSFYSVVWILCIGCGEEGYDEVVAGRWFLDDDTSVIVDQEVSSGQSSSIKITTSGNSCTSFHSTEVTVRENVVDITPYDRRSSSDGFCEDNEVRIDHSTSVTLNEVGRTLIRVHGSFDERGKEAIERDFIVHVGF
jgi:hypothetical protein